ncbi:MlaD family protein [Pseudonocardia sp. H11422]|uniref:MlaD family protein n=1 Tax=Pseudonocardia sp. H11422 TaxID=2835866 RepID=UPI001BDCFF1B|nr:MlaD family protein [Pseudonocardia sp. H11422]
MLRKLLTIGCALVTVLATSGVVALAAGASGDYEIKVVMPSAVGIVTGLPVQINGFDVGEVTDVAAQDNHGVVTLALSDEHAPLPTGTTVVVEWRSVLGEHFLQLHPGPASNPELPSGSMIPAGSSQVLVEDLLEALDEPTRAHLTSVADQLQETFDGSEPDVNALLGTAGPTVEALGAVLDAVGRDGPAIRELITNARQITAVLAQRQDKLAGTITDLGQMADVVAAQQQQLTDGLAELPSTLDAAQGALDRVPAAADSTVPMLEDLRPAAARLPSVAANLSPVLRDLRPTVEQLHPTLDAANKLLQFTPGLLDNATATLPGVTQAVRTLGPAVAFLRPYTPEMMGMIDNWGNVYSQYNGSGHFGHLLISYGQTAVNNQPNAVPLGGQVNPAPAPGHSAGQPWTDANGNRPR